MTIPFTLEAFNMIGWNCNYPDGQGEGVDIGLGIVCPDHPRTVYFCAESQEIWCDGGAPDWPHHRLLLISELPS